MYKKTIDLCIKIIEYIVKNNYKDGVFNMKNILVTGATGFIGSHTSVELLENGYNV
ncbi:UDP-galactose 4-epimerase, partial [Candidatus Arthromitus sp. SFB-2]